MNVFVCPDYETLSRKAAKRLADLVRAKPDAVLGFATGSSPLGLYQELIRLHTEEGLDFSAVTTFNLDEYCGLTGDHPQSYRRFMNENLFNHINVPMEKTHVPSGTAENWRASCAEYEKRIVEAGGIDCQVLGIGSDGHIAFNEPGSSLGSRTRRVYLTEQTLQDNARFFEKAEDVPTSAISMGVGTILEARTCVMVVSGANKADALAEAVEGPVTSMNTASALQWHPETFLFCDEASAAKLTMRAYYDWIAGQMEGDE